jgi:hypothetical protein
MNQKTKEDELCHFSKTSLNHDHTASHLDLRQILSLLAALDRAKSKAPSDPRQEENSTTTGTTSGCTNDGVLLRCTLVEKGGIANVLGDVEKECRAQKQALREQFGLDETDLRFILDHISAAQDRKADVRWDLIEALVFPEDLGHHLPPQHHDSDTDDLALGDGDLFLSRQEHYQEVILELFAIHEESQNLVPPRELYRRQQVLIYLLRATSDEEAHLTTLSLNDVSEIVAHVELCIEHKLDVQWPMLESIVFPLGLPMDEQEEVVTEMARNNTCAIDQKDANDSSETHGDPLQKYVDLSEAELETVLNHINLCAEVGKEIRWDLLAEVLFPCNDARKRLLVSNSSFNSKLTKNVDKVQELPTANATGVVKQERARAILSLSTHDWNVASTHPWNAFNGSEHDIQEGSCGSFYEDSSGSVCSS